MAEAAAAELNRQLPGRVWRRQVRLDRVVIGVAMACLVVLIAFPLAMLLIQAIFPAGQTPFQPFGDTFAARSNYLAILDSIVIG
ncbi:MAG TPA: hypothetical protein VN959_05720, partial [Mycobacterium sp.]|nr:hypothetical protein [Mycobacterium sp.]